MFFFLSSIRRHTRCALVTGVQTCALRSVKYSSPDCPPVLLSPHTRGATMALELEVSLFGDAIGTLALVDGRLSFRYAAAWLAQPDAPALSVSLPLHAANFDDIGRASCRERACQYV